MKKRTAVDLTGVRILERLVYSVIAIPTTLLQLLLGGRRDKCLVHCWESNHDF